MSMKLDPVFLRDVARIKAKLGKFPKAAAAAGIEQASNYLIRVLVRKELPPYKYVSRRQAYGKPFQSDRQRRWFFWALATGRIVIPYRRRSPRGGLAASWMIIGSGVDRSLENALSSAYWVYSQRQSRQLKLVGWKKISAIVTEYEKNIYASFMRGVRKTLRELGLQ